MPLNREQALSRLPEAFHLLLNDIWDNYLYADDEVLACTCFTSISHGGVDTSVLMPRNTAQAVPYFVVLTSHRWIQAQLGRSNEGIVYRKQGRAFLNLSGTNHKAWEWKFPPSYPKSAEEFKRFKVIHEFPLSSFPEIQSRETFSTTHNSKEWQFVEIRLREADLWIGDCLVFQQKDAEEIYVLLQNAAANRGHIRLSNEVQTNKQVTDIVKQLQKIAELHAQRALTQEEFEKLKAKLLG